MKKHYHSLPLLLLLGITLLTSCNPIEKQSQERTVIALSKSYENYQTWLLEADSAVKFINVYGIPVSEVPYNLSLVDGIVVTGGEDIHPAWYGRARDTALCNTINMYRDSLDAAIINYASDEGIPLLGICRGMQMMNVALGGSLYADIPTQISGEVAHRQAGFRDTLHKVRINQASLLHLIGDAHEASVVSNHHQGVRDLAPGLRKVAEAGDELTEAVEWKEPAGKAFFLGVQFHPERNDSKLSRDLAIYFTDQASRFHQRNKQNTE